MAKLVELRLGWLTLRWKSKPNFIQRMIIRWYYKYS